MIDNNLVSSKAVIAKIIADNDMREDDIRITDIKEWCGEALEKIGAVLQLLRKLSIIPVINYLAKLPCDLHSIEQIGFSNTNSTSWLPMKKATGSFSCIQPEDNSCDCECECDDLCMIVQDSALIPLAKTLYNISDDKSALDIINSDSNIRSTLSALLNVGTVSTLNPQVKNLELEYMTKPGYAITSRRNGFIKVSYKAIIIDDDGMPLVPDSTSYFEAIYWYVTMKLEFPKYKSGKTPRYIFYDIKNSWNFYRKLAYAEAMMPTVDDLETIKNTWHTLMPEMHEHASFFTSTGNEQRIYNLNR